MTHDLRVARTRIERSNAELERRRRYVETVFGSIGAGVMSLDAEGRVYTLNPSARHWLGVPADTDVLGCKLRDVARRPELLTTLEQLRAKLLPAVRESVRHHTEVAVGDDVVTLLVTLEVLYDEFGEPSGTVVVFDDTTQLVKVQRMEAWREIAQRIAHEIKNPLTPIQLSAQRIRRRFAARFADDPDDARVLEECVDAISNHVRSLEILVDEFSNFARLPAAHPEPADLNAIVSEAVASYRGTDGVELVAELDSSLPTVDLDREQIRRALTNLIDNAIAAVRAGAAEREAGCRGRVCLRTAHDSALDRIRLEIADDGIGIPRESRRRVFEPYYSTKQKGTGLGLAIVSRIVADHRGHVRIYDHAPHGARFVVELPVRGV
jgi:two-component system nitrogen regulation sensor histidine kinase NtrY